MNDKNVLFIEDGDITEQVDRLRGVLQKQGITLVETILNLSDSKYRKVHPDDTRKTILNIDEIKGALRNDYMNKRFDYVLCDFDFADDKLDGFELIKWLKNVVDNEKQKLRIAKFSLYSSEPDKFLKKHMTEEDISALIKLKLNDFYSRTKIAVDFGSDVLNSSNEMNLKEKLILELVKHKEMKFQSIYPKFKDKTLEEIVAEIEKDSYHGNAFQEAIIELTVAHLIDLNKV